MLKTRGNLRFGRRATRSRTPRTAWLLAVGFSAVAACQGADDDDADPGAGTGGAEATAGATSEAGNSGDNPGGGGETTNGGTRNDGGETGNGGVPGHGGATTDGGAATTAGVAGEGGAATDGGAAGMAGGGGGAGGRQNTGCPREALNSNTGELLFNALEPCDAVGKALFLFGERLYWQYESEGRAFIARGPKPGGTAEIVVDSAQPIEAFDARGVVVYQAGGKLFALAPSSANWVELEDATHCLALTSTAAYVYCRNDEQEVWRWSSSGGKPTLFASRLGPGVALLAAPLEDKLLYFSEGTGLWDLPLRPLPPAPPPPIWDRPQPHAPASAHTFRMLPGDAELFFMAPSGLGASQIVSATNGVQVDGLKTTFDFAPLLGVGIAFATDLWDGSTRLTLSPSATMNLDYSSRDGVAGMTSEPRHLYWLDRRGRVFHGVPTEPDYGHDDDFTSRLDARPLKGLSPAETRSLCDELIDYAKTPSPEVLLHASCVARQGTSDASVSTCEARAEECVRLSPWVQGPFLDDDCLADVAAWSECGLTVANYSACVVVKSKDLEALVRTATCDAVLRGDAIDDLDRAPARECFVLQATCPTDD